MKISSPSSPNLTFGLDSENHLVHLHCSVRGNPIPRLQWSRHDGQDNRALDAVQLPTGFNQSALSVLTINITELGRSNHTFQCTATLDVNSLYYGALRLSSSLAASISIRSLNDIRIVPELFMYNFSSSSEDGRNRFILVNCSVRAYPHEPRFEWSHSGNLDTNVTNYMKPLVSVGVVYWSVLHYPLAKMMNGENLFTCRTYTPQASLVAHAVVIIPYEGRFCVNFCLSLILYTGYHIHRNFR